MREAAIVAMSAIGSVFYHLFGPWNSLFEAMFVFMVLDFAMGFLVAAIFKKSPNSRDGKLWSVPMKRGLIKKGMALVFVIVGQQLDYVIERDYVKPAIMFFIIGTELLSIIENAALMGIPVPSVLRRMLTVLNDKAGEHAADKFADDVLGRIDKDDNNPKRRADDK